MAGSLLNLAFPTTRIPARLVLDSSVIIDWPTAAGRPAAAVSPPTPGQRRATRLVGSLQAERAVGLVTPTSLNEVFHVVLKIGYRAELPN